MEFRGKCHNTVLPVHNHRGAEGVQFRERQGEEYAEVDEGMRESDNL